MRPALSVAELAILFHGDGSSDDGGCAHVQLVVAICEQTAPTTPHQLFCAIYGLPEQGPDGGKAGAELVAELPEHVVRTIDAGYGIWKRRQRVAA